MQPTTFFFTKLSPTSPNLFLAINGTLQHLLKHEKMLQRFKSSFSQKKHKFAKATSNFFKQLKSIKVTSFQSFSAFIISIILVFNSQPIFEYSFTCIILANIQPLKGILVCKTLFMKPHWVCGGCYLSLGKDSLRGFY